MPSLKKITTLRLDEELCEILKKLAEEDNRSLNNYIEKILKEHILKNKNELIEDFKNNKNSSIKIGNNNDIKNSFK